MKEKIDKMAFEAKNNDIKRQYLIKSYKPFIAKVASKTVNKSLKYGKDEELSIALVAFNMAIDKYDIDKGPFLRFSANIIRYRLIDYLRKKYKENEIEVYPLEYENKDQIIDNTQKKAIEKYNELVISEYRRLEINEYMNELKEYGITFEKLEKASPKQERTIKAIDEVIENILSREDIVSEMKEKKYLQIKKISQISKITPKKMERFRNYIIGTVILRSGEYEYLNSFIKWG